MEYYRKHYLINVAILTIVSCSLIISLLALAIAFVYCLRVEFTPAVFIWIIISAMLFFWRGRCNKFILFWKERMDYAINQSQKDHN